MQNNKIENEKFVFRFVYNKKLEKFEKIEYDEKNLNNLEKKILDEACLLFPNCNVQELYEHLIIRIENRLRNFNKTTYTGVLLPENVAEEYKYFQIFFRDFLKPFIKNDLKEKINFQTLKPSDDWIYLNDDQKKIKIYEQLEKYFSLNPKLHTEIKIIKIENKINIYIDFLKKIDIDIKNKLCFDLEIFLKNNLEESLNIYLETSSDENKLRRLKL